MHPGSFCTKESFQLGSITNWFKKYGVSKRYTLQELFDFTNQGKCFIPSHIETNGKEYDFVSSQLMFVDVDDDEKLTNPLEVLKELEEVCVGLFYTSSHCETKNRYRLVFVLDEYIRDIRTYEFVFNYLVEKLEFIGVIADKSIKTPLQRIRTATKGYEVNNFNAVLPVKEIIEIAQLEKEKLLRERSRKLQEVIENKEVYSYSFEELKARAEVIGYVNDFNEWSTLAYSLKSYVEEGYIDDIEGYEIFSNLCGGNDETVFWNSLKTNRITIGTFIYRSNEAGFKKSFKYYHAVSNVSSSLEVEKIRYDKYIPIEFSKSVLEREKKILVKSPTGSGKTFSFINAAKEIAEELKKENQTRFFIFAVPTVAITDQVANDNNILAVRGETSNLYDKVRKYVYSGQNVVVCTYDMVQALESILSAIKPFASYGLIVDEFHQTTHSYGYRRKAIEGVYSLLSKVKTFVALSGTPDDCLRDIFDEEIHVSTKHEKSPCQMWGVLTYDKKDEEEVLLFQLLLQKARSGKKILLFLQNKDGIDRIQTQLKKEGINAAKITADGKLTNPTYKVLVHESKFPEDIQIILTTSLASDGLNVHNESLEYECIVVATQSSPLFNVDQVRQMTNRFRKPYRAFYVYMQKAKREARYLYNIESAFDYEKMLAQNAVNLIAEEFKGKNSNLLFRKASIEKRFDIAFNSEEKVKYNVLTLRYNVSKEKSDYYKVYRNQYIEALTKLIGIKPLPSIDITQYMSENNADLTDIKEQLDELKELSKMDKAIKQENIAKSYSKEIYEAFVTQNDEVLKIFKQAVTAEHYSCIKGLAAITDYQTSFNLVQKVQRRADINSYKNRIEALANIRYYNAINRKTPSKEAYESIKEYLGKELTKTEVDSIVLKVSKKFKRSKLVDVNQIANNYFFHESIKKGKGSRFTILHELSVEKISEVFNLNSIEVEKSIANYAKKEGSLLAKVILK